jgi:hypothetical protein
MMHGTFYAKESSSERSEDEMSQTQNHGGIEQIGSNDRAEPSHTWTQCFLSIVGFLLGLGDDVFTVTANRIRPKKVRWLWPDRIPLGKLTLFVGNPDNGKSLAAIYVTAITTTGGDWYSPGQRIQNPIPAGDVLIFADEDEAADTIVPRLIAAGANCASVHLCKMQAVGTNETAAQRQMRLDADLDAIQKCLKENPAIRLVVLDPLSNHMGDININSELEVRRVLIPLVELAEKTSVAILGVMHLNKDENKRSTSRVSGAMAFVGVARSVWIFDTDSETEGMFHMVRLKQNIAKRKGGLRYQISTTNVEIEGERVPQPFIEWLGESSLSADSILAAHSPKRGRPREERKRAEELLRINLADAPLPQKEIERLAELEEISPSTLDRAKEGLQVESVKSRDGWLWKLPGLHK